MENFVELQGRNGVVYINPRHVSAVADSDDEGRSYVYMAGSSEDPWNVAGSPEDIVVAFTLEEG